MFSHSLSVLGSSFTDWIIKQDMIAAKYFCLITAAKRYFAPQGEQTMHEGNLLTLLPPYFSLMSKSHVKDGCSSLWCVWAKQLYLWLGIRSHALNVWLTVMFVKRNKPHKVDRNCKMLYVFQLTICSGNCVGSVCEKICYMANTTMQGSEMLVLKEFMSHYYIFFFSECGFLSFFFLSSLGLGVILWMKSTD